MSDEDHQETLNTLRVIKDDPDSAGELVALGMATASGGKITPAMIERADETVAAYAKYLKRRLT